MKTTKLVVKDVVRLFPSQNPKELATSWLLFNIVVPNGRVYRLARSKSEAAQGYLVLEVESLEFPGIYADYAEVPPPGHGDMGLAKRFKAVVNAWRPEAKEVLEMEVTRLTDKFAVLELQYRHKTIAIGSCRLSKLFGHHNFTPKGTFVVDAKKRRIELGQRLKAVVSSYEIEEIGANYRFRINFSNAIPPWDDGTRGSRSAKASVEKQLDAT